MRLYFMEFNIRGPKYGKCETSSDDILKIEGRKDNLFYLNDVYVK